MSHRIFKIIFWNILIVILLFFLLEVTIRISFPEIQLSGLDRRVLQSDVYYTSTGLKKNSKGESNGIIKEVDENGFWKYENNKRRSSRKILILGDSATMGLGVENDSTFAGLLNAYLNNVEFYNASLIGYSSLDYLNVTRSLIKSRENDLKITDIFIFWCLNDIYTNFPDLKSPETKSDLVKTLSNFLGKNSKIYHLLKNTFSDRPKAYFNYDKQFYLSDNEQLKKSFFDLQQIAQIADSAKIDVSIFLLPYEYQIRNLNGSKIFQPQVTFKYLLEDLKIDVTDCSPAFNQFNLNSRYLYLYGDGIHFSKPGHRLIAKYIYEKVKNNLEANESKPIK